MYTIIVVAFLKKTAAIETTGIRLHDGDLEHSLTKEKKIDVYILFSIFPFWHSRFTSRNLKDAKSCMFSCMFSCSLLICSWHDTTLSQFVQ